MKLVLPLSPRQSCKSLVRVEFLYGTCLFCPRARAWITFLKSKGLKMLEGHFFVCLVYIFFAYPSSSNEVFKYFASVRRTPSALVLVNLSLPAKSHLQTNQENGVKIIYSPSPHVKPWWSLL